MIMLKKAYDDWTKISNSGFFITVSRIYSPIQARQVANSLTKS